MKIALLVVAVVMFGNLSVITATVLIMVRQWEHLEAGSIAVLVAVMGGSLGALTNMGSLVIGFYFGRTNHTRTGGVMPHDTSR